MKVLGKEESFEYEFSIKWNILPRLRKTASFTRAADALHITQQTLSAHIAGIERELGCPLLIRHIPLELTYAGGGISALCNGI